MPLFAKIAGADALEAGMLAAFDRRIGLVRDVVGDVVCVLAQGQTDEWPLRESRRIVYHRPDAQVVR